MSARRIAHCTIRSPRSKTRLAFPMARSSSGVRVRWRRSVAPRLDAIQPIAEQSAQVNQAPLAARKSGEGLWLTTRQLAEGQGWTMRATYSWLSRHGIVRRNDGRVSRRDVQRELNRRSLRGRTAGTLANLRALAASRRKG